MQSIDRPMSARIPCTNSPTKLARRYKKYSKSPKARQVARESFEFFPSKPQNTNIATKMSRYSLPVGHCTSLLDQFPLPPPPPPVKLQSIAIERCVPPSIQIHSSLLNLTSFFPPPRSAPSNNNQQQQQHAKANSFASIVGYNSLIKHQARYSLQILPSLDLNLPILPPSNRNLLENIPPPPPVPNPMELYVDTPRVEDDKQYSLKRITEELPSPLPPPPPLILAPSHIKQYNIKQKKQNKKGHKRYKKTIKLKNILIPNQGDDDKSHKKQRTRHKKKRKSQNAILFDTKSKHKNNKNKLGLKSKKNNVRRSKSKPEILCNHQIKSFITMNDIGTYDVIYNARICGIELIPFNKKKNIGALVVKCHNSYSKKRVELKSLLVGIGDIIVISMDHNQIIDTLTKHKRPLKLTFYPPKPIANKKLQDQQIKNNKRRSQKNNKNETNLTVWLGNDDSICFKSH